MWANTIYDVADPCNATINFCVELCHQFGKRRAGELFYTNRCAQYHGVIATTGMHLIIRNPLNKKSTRHSGLRIAANSFE